MSVDTVTRLELMTIRKLDRHFGYQDVATVS